MKSILVAAAVCAAAFSAGAFDVSGIQKAIDAASAGGGGTVTVPKGTWETGPFALKNGVTLHLEKGAVLLGCTNSAVYRAAGLSALIHTVGATNVAIEGEGTIDGRGGLITTASRPHLVNFRNCRNVRVEGVTLRCGGSWTLNPLRCDGVTIRNVKIWSHVNHCNDGIDVSSSNVLIENCDIDADDDALVFKTPAPDVVVENVKVRNCRIASSCNAIKFGTESHGVMRNVDIRDCTIAPTSAQGRFDWRSNTPGVTDYLAGLSGIAVECVDGEALEDITISGIRLDGYQTPIIVRFGRRNESRTGRPACLKNVLIENVKATGPSRSRIACAITGVKGLRPSGITLRNIDLVFPGGGTFADFATPVPEVENAYPENRMFNALPLPAYAFYVRHADGVRLENVKASLVSGDERPAVVIDDAQVDIAESCVFQAPTGGAKTVERLPEGSAAIRKAQYWKSIDTGDAYFMRAQDGSAGKPPLVVYLGTTREKPPELALGECRTRRWSMLAPFARDAKGVLSALAKVKDQARMVFLKGDGPQAASLALEVLAAAPKDFAAVSAISPASCPAGLDKVKDVDIDIIVAARNAKASAGFAAYNALCSVDDRIPADLADVMMKTGKAPDAYRFKGTDVDFPRNVRPLIFRRETGRVCISVTALVNVSCVKPSFVRFAQGAAVRVDPPLRLILAGDSTMQWRSRESKAGSWAEALAGHLKDGVEIVNCARGGRSTRTFAPDWATNVVPRIRPGDWVLIQFGHNDMSKASDPKIDRQTDPDTEYPNNLRRFVADVRLKGGNPVLVTPISLYLYGRSNGKWMGKNPLSRWVEAMKRLAAESRTPIIDLNAATFAAVRDAGAEKAAKWYMFSVDGKDWAHPTKAGADRFAEMFVGVARSVGSPVTALLRQKGNGADEKKASVACGVKPMQKIPAEWQELLVQVKSSLDGTMQPCWFWAPEKAKSAPVPLIVGLHTWSADYSFTSHYSTVLKYAKAHGWAMVGPNFRGPNSTPPACGSDLAVQDIVDAVEYAKSHVKIDAKRIYIVGGSGGGHMTLLMAGRHPEIWAGCAAFCPITDVARWHADSLLDHPGRGKGYAKMLVNACGGTPAEKPDEYRKRSPLTWLSRAAEAGVPCYIVTGIHDGWKGSVPVGHSFRAFNALAAEQDRIPESAIAEIEETQKVPDALKYTGPADPFYPEKMRIHFRRTSRNVRFTLFEGGHGGNYAGGLDFLSRQTKGCPADFRLPSSGKGGEEALGK